MALSVFSPRTPPAGLYANDAWCGTPWNLSLAIVLFFRPNAVPVVAKGTVVSGASALAEKPCDFGKSRIVLVDKDRMDFYS